MLHPLAVAYSPSPPPPPIHPFIIPIVVSFLASYSIPSSFSTHPLFSEQTLLHDLPFLDYPPNPPSPLLLPSPFFIPILHLNVPSSIVHPCPSPPAPL